MNYEVIGGDPNPSLTKLNQKAVSKLYELLDGMDAKSDPDLVRAVVESLAKLNSSLKGSDILPQEESAEEKRSREERDAIMGAING